MLDKTNFYINLGRKIKEERTKRGYSLDKLSEVSGLNLSRSRLSIIENGKQQVSAFQLYLITEALDLKITELMKGLESNNKSLLNNEELKELSDL